MEAELLLKRKVGELQRRLRLLVAQQGAIVGLTAAGALGCALALAAQLRWLPAAVDWIAPLLVMGALAGLAYGWSRRITPLAAARVADRELDLKERLSTALSISDFGFRISDLGKSGPEQSEIGAPTKVGHPKSEIELAQLADAAERARDVRPAQVFPWRLPRQAKYCGSTLALLLGILYLPELPMFRSEKERAESAAMAAAGKQYQEAARELERKKSGDPSNDEILRRIARNLKQLGRDQERGRVSKKEALLRANELKKTLEEAERKLGTAPSSKSMEQAASDLRQAAERHAKAGNAELARSMQQLSEALEKGDLQEAQREMERLSDQLKQTAAQGKTSAEEMRQAAEAMQQMADAVSGSKADAAKAELKDAAQKMGQAASQLEKLQADLQKAQSPQQRQEIEQLMQATSQKALNDAAT